MNYCNWKTSLFVVLLFISFTRVAFACNLQGDWNLTNKEEFYKIYSNGDEFTARCDSSSKCGWLSANISVSSNEVRIVFDNHFQDAGMINAEDSCDVIGWSSSTWVDCLCH